MEEIVSSIRLVDETTIDAAGHILRNDGIDFTLDVDVMSLNEADLDEACALLSLRGIGYEIAA